MREDYTPTTDEVRTWYMETYSGPDGRRGLAFDRWSAGVERKVAEKALARVRALHRETGEQLDDAGVRYTVCEHCTQVNRYGQVRFPCPTIRALEGDE